MVTVQLQVTNAAVLEATVVGASAENICQIEKHNS